MLTKQQPQNTKHMNPKNNQASEDMAIRGGGRDSMPLFRDSVSIPSSPMQLEVRKCNVHVACGLNKTWHSRFPHIDWSNIVRNRDYVCHIAEYDNIAYAVAIWSSPIAANRLKEGKTALELRRMAISSDAPKNTASRMISLMRKKIQREMPHITLLVSYQDTDVHAGTIYKASGWTAASQNKGTSWTNEKRTRNVEQSLADKIRWEYRINPRRDRCNARSQSADLVELPNLNENKEQSEISFNP